MSERDRKDYEDVLRAALSLTMGRDMTRPPVGRKQETSVCEACDGHGVIALVARDGLHNCRDCRGVGGRGDER